MPCTSPTSPPPPPSPPLLASSVLPAVRMAQIWAYLLRPHIDLNVLTRLLESAVDSGQQALRFYSSLLCSFPNSIPLLRSARGAHGTVDEKNACIWRDGRIGTARKSHTRLSSSSFLHPPLPPLSPPLREAIEVTQR